MSVWDVLRKDFFVFLYECIGKMVSAKFVIAILFAIVLSCVVNGVLTYAVGRNVQCYTQDLGKILFWSGFMVSVLTGLFSLVFQGCEMKAVMMEEKNYY